MTDDLREFELLQELEEQRRITADTLRKARKAKDRHEALVEATYAGMRDALRALGPLKPVPAPKLGRGKAKPEVALWHLTDWQGCKVTPSFNFEVLRKRMMLFCDKAEQLTKIQRAHHPVDRAVVCLGGDMGEGLFNYPTQPYEIDASLFGQFTQISRLEAEVVRRALAIYRHVEVITEWGNHGRVGDKRAAVPRSDNFDRMIHHLAGELLSDEKRLVWRDCPEDVQRIEIGNYRALLIHGDEFGRSGYVSKNTMIKKIADWKSGAYPWTFQDCLYGHYHGHCEDPLPDGEGVAYGTGSPESDNRYAGIRMASSRLPSQRLHFIDPDKSRVAAQYKVQLV